MPKQKLIKIPINDLKIGDSAEICKKMTIEMVEKFSIISEDFNPIHLDSVYAANSRYKKQIIHGMMASSLFSGLFGTTLPGEGCIYKSQDIRFKRAIYIGDIVTAKVEIVFINLDNKIITFKTICLVRDKIMIDGEAEIFIP